MRRMTSAFVATAGLALGSMEVAAPAAQAADPLSGTIAYAGHRISWSLTGAAAAPAVLSASYDGVVQEGATVTVAG